MNKLKYLILVLLITITTTSCSLFKRDIMENINIVTTIYPLEYALNSLYGENSVINSIYPDDVNTLTYQITDKKYKDSSNQDLFVYMGKISNDFDIAVQLISRNNKLKVIDGTRGMEYKNDTSELWLNPSNLLMILQNIKNGLNEYIDNAYLKEEVNEKYQELKMVLSNVDASFKTTIENANKKTIYTNSNALKFLEKYGLKVIVVNKDLDLYEKNLALLNNEIEKKNINYFYFIEDSTLDIDLQKLVDEGKFKILEFRDLRNITDEERNNKKDYVDITNMNIETLKKELY